MTKFEKINQYQDIAWELQEMWNTKVKVISPVIGSIATTPKDLRKWLSEIGLVTQITDLQKTILLHKARILGKVFKI